MTKPILTVPNEILRATSKDVVFDKKISEFVSDLSSTLFAKDNPKGVGLSAPQIGKNWNVFVTWLAPDPEDDPTPSDLKVFINPSLTDHSTETTFGPDEDDPVLEGCLSIPTLYGPVPRFEWVEVEYATIQVSGIRSQVLGNKTDTLYLEPKTLRKRFSGFEARVIQHEYDHLQGMLFTDYSLKYDLPIYEYSGKKMKEIDKKIIEGF